MRGFGRIARSDQIELLALGGVDATVGATGTHLRESQRGRLAWFLGALTSTTDRFVLLGDGRGGQHPGVVRTVGDLTATALWLWPRS
jgi:hypothetical protein